MEPPLTSKVLRAPNLKRGQENIKIQDRIKLERVLGVTVSSNAALDCDTTSDLVAYPAGCTVVLFNPRKNTQTHVLNGSRKTVTSLALSGDGRLLVTGECGHTPNVRVWDISDPRNAIQIAEFPSHKYGINCVAFSPSNKYVVSVGSQHDMIVNVWDWRNNVKVASNKVSSKVKAVSFAESGNYFVTVGNRHVKFWYLEYCRNAKYQEPVPLMGRSAILGEQRNNDFVDVACGCGEMADSTYAITKTGLLCEFNNRRLLDKWVELRTTSANCIAVGEKYIFIGCAEGIIRCFSPTTLQFITTLPRTHYLGVDVAQGLTIDHMSQHPSSARYPDAVALAFDEQNNKLTCVYNDHSIYVWDIRDIRRVGKSHSFLYHSACIWGVEMYPNGDESVNSMPAGSFVTCSSDDTIRIWNLQKDLPPDETMYNRNIYSNELLKVLYVDPELTYLKDLDLAAAGTTDKSDSSYDSRNGVRSIRISPDGRHLASGDRCGNIRIHDVTTLDETCVIEAHDAEVLCLEYSKYTKFSSDLPRLLASASRDRLIHVFNVDEGYDFLQTLDDHSSSITAVRFFNQSDKLQMVSCGADKSIIFRQLQGTPGGSPQFSRGHNVAGKATLYDMELDSGQKHILTACQDRNIRVYSATTGKHNKTFKGSVGEDGSLIKVVLDASGIYVATSCTDKTLCVYDYYSGECMATMLGHSELVTGLRFSPDCRHLISASGDGCIFVWKVPHDMVVTMQARLAQQAFRAGKKKTMANDSEQLDNETFGPPTPEFLDPNANSTMQSLIDYRFSVGQLPQWAKKQINTSASANEESIGSSGVRSLGVDMPKGRWAQRVQQADGITVKSVYDSDEIIPFPPPRGAIDSDGGGGGLGGSKDSSIDSGTETKCSSDYRRETVMIKRDAGQFNIFQPCPDSYRELVDDSKQMTGGNVTVTRGNNDTEFVRQSRTRHHTDDSSLGSLKFEDHESTEHDGDVEDYSEGENGTTSSEKSHHHLMYYPPTEDIVSNQFKVNAMDVEELRRSQRRSKKIRTTETGRNELASGSQDDSDSEGGISTPSAERNPLSILSETSSEGFDQITNQSHREKYLKNAFESLSGADEPTNRKNTSISSQFHGRNSGEGVKSRATPKISIPNNPKKDVNVTKNREELKRRIEETRKKLQSVGYKSSLKSSQSISDLSSHIPNRHHRQNRLGTGNLSSAQVIRYAIPTNPIKPQLKTQSIQLNSPLPTKNINSLYKIHEPMQKIIPKSQTMSSINDQKIRTNANRPLTLTLKRTEKYQLSLNKPNHSLPDSPVCEELKLLKKKCTNSANSFAHYAQKRRSCSYFIGLNDNSENVDKITKSFESLPAMNEQVFNADKDDGNFSDDSLESEYTKPPRRCISEYQININADGQVNSNSCQNLGRTKLTESQESILSDASIDGFDGIQYDNGRHSSASFFLSRKKIHGSRSQESVLTDGTEDYQTFSLHENEDHRSTESVLSDDSDSLVKSAPLEMLFDSHYKRKRQNSETYNANPKNQTETTENNHSDNVKTTIPNRSVFRSKSLQDTRLSTEKSGINYTEENFRPNQTCIYYEFNVDDGNDYETKARTLRSEIGRSHSLRMSKAPQSALILDDFVPHKPPKPTRNLSRAQSMKNRARPTWTRHNIDSQPKPLSDLPAGNNESDKECPKDAMKNNHKNIQKAFQEVQTSTRVMNIDIVSTKINSDQLVVDRIERQFEKFEKSRREDKYPKPKEADRDSGFENQVPTKDTENYDSLEPNGISSADVSTSDSQTPDSSGENKSKNGNINTNVDIRMTRAIEGTVKLLSKEFESLVRREEYFTNERRAWRLQPKENEYLTRLENEKRRAFIIKQDNRRSSGGEDSDCAMDKSIMESGSSTTGSSCTNSPKRVWPPASRCQLKWTNTLLPLSHCILPSKHHFVTVTGARCDTSASINNEDDEEGSGMRRACSLSDLSVNPSNRLLHVPIRVSGKTSNKNSNQLKTSTGSGTSGSASSRYSSNKIHSNHMTRSCSVGVLNQQSDSESDAGMTSAGRHWSNQGQNNRMSGLMRPTISSQNKINYQTKQNSNSSNNLPMVLRRRGMQSSYSSVNLSQVGNQEDSSSEDTSSNGNSVKPVLPPRPKSINIEPPSSLNLVPAIRRSGSNATLPNCRSMSSITQGGARLSSRKQLDPSPQELPVKDTDHAIDVVGAELSPQLCNTIAEELTRTADNVVQLYKRLTMDHAGGSSGETIDRDTMLRGLESSVNEAMRTLRLVAAGAGNKENNIEGQLPASEATETFQELLAGQDQGRVVNMMQQYSDMLLSMMQQRMGGAQSNHA